MSEDFLDDVNMAEGNIPETLIDIDTSDAQEPICVEDGEYEVRITGFRKDTAGHIVRTSEKGNKYFIITFDIPSEEFSKGLSKIFSIPRGDEEPKRMNSIKWELECLKRAFGMAELNFNNMVGKTSYALVKKTQSETYGEQNEISKLIIGA